MDWKKRLTKARLDAGYKRKSHFANAVGVSAPTVTDWEKAVEDGGIDKLRAENLVKICHILNINSDWLLDGVGPQNRSGFGTATPRLKAILGVSDEDLAELESLQGLPAIDSDRRHEHRRAHDLELVAPQGSDEVMIPQYNAGGAMGNGLVLDGLAGIIKSWRVDLEWLRLNVRNHTGVKNLCIVTGFGPSMRPMFNPGDPLLLDKGITTFDHEDAIYFFRVGNYGYIKTVQRIPTQDGGIIYRAKSKNPDYDPFDITREMDLEVFGKILTVWKSEQF
ncbi:MAG: hypothetical protein A3I66_01255 [Burkholderiales bacterium RIFCSPLOWO2_02_FULL_57_36]|nr:MAG: hypothetical protein A3I66_01255 [Burkholderiales bacterium RIFCSPLOWO2_02_FULL_57_36]